MKILCKYHTFTRIVNILHTCITKQTIITIIIHDFIFMIGACLSKISRAIKISYKYTAPKNKYVSQRIIYRKTKTVSDNFYEIFGRKSCSKKQSRLEIKNGHVRSTKIETVVNRCKSSVTRGRTMIKRISPTIVDMYFHLFSVVICLFLPLLLAPFLPSFLLVLFLSRAFSSGSPFYSSY